MSVSIQHQLYTKRFPQWKTMRDCIEGEDAIKAGGEAYLPRISGYSDCQYKNYQTRARFVNYTKRVLDGLHGLIFRRNPVTKKPDGDAFNDVLKNVDKKGSSLYQFTSDVTYDVMITGFGGLMVDFPRVEMGMDGLTAERNGIRPYVRYYPAESIINWKFGVVNGFEQLVTVVLKESRDVSVDPFSHEEIDVYRVLILIDGIYHQWIMREGSVKKDRSGNPIFDKNGAPVQEDDILEDDIVVTINGSPLPTLPFFTMPGSEPAVPLLLDLAKCNIGHYQKSADYENGVHMTTIPTGYVTGHEKYIDPETKEEEVVILGAESFLMFREPEAKVGTLVFSGEGLTHSEKALETAMSDMAILGSRLVTPEKGTSESADSAKIHRAGENARLAGLAKNISESFTKAFQTIADWMNIGDEVRIELCTDYDTLSFDPNALNALANLAEAGRMPLPYVFWNIKNGEYTPDEATLKEYITLLEMEKGGISLMDELEAYEAMREGKKTIKRPTVSAKDLNPSEQE